jgi:rare lipoprotein A
MAERTRRAAAALIAATGLLALAACAETELAINTAKRIAPAESSPSAHPVQGLYKVGKPYQVNGVWYYPRVDYSYDETGIASWYGPDFHARRTANGEIYDMNALTAAHKTLPLPSIVRVVNLRNGRAVKLRVNDRGPFVNGRIIDVSRRAAQLLGFIGQGTAPVRVEVIADESRRVAALAQGGPQAVASAPTQPVAVSSLAGAPPPSLPSKSAAPTRSSLPPVVDPTPAAEPLVTHVPVKPVSGMYIQAGAFIQREYALRLQRRLASIGPTRIVEATVGQRRFYRVRLGPVSTVEEGDRLLERVLKSGSAGARLVVE